MSQAITAGPITRTGPSNPALAATILRVSLGILFLAHAGLKIFVFTPAGTVGFFESLGLPGPLAYLVIAAELLGGIVNNESAEIVRMFNAGFGELADGSVDFYPAELASEIDALNARIYPRLNNGVYRAGFATTQVAYDEAFAEVFAMLDELERRFADGRAFLLGDRFTEADIRLFVTLVRFDAAYHGLFKCNLRRIADYPGLSAYLARILAIPGVRETVDIDHIKRGYYSIKALNPTGIMPMGPELTWLPK